MTVRRLTLPDDAEPTRTLLARSDPATGLIVVQVRPGMRHLGWIAKDVLSALGQSLAPRTTGRIAAEDIARCRAWLRGHRVAHLVVIDSQILRPKLLEELVDLAEDAGMDLWLADHLPTSDRHEEELQDLGVLDVYVGDLPAPAGVAHASPANGTPPTPTVPRADFARFRSQARRLLEPADFDRVDEIYRFAFEHIVKVAACGSDLVAATFLLVNQASDGEARIVSLRAAQAAAFICGIDLEIDLTALTAELCDVAPSAQAARRQLASYADPQRAIVCLLAVLGLAPDQQLSLKLTDIADDGARIGTTSIPAWAQPVVRAHQHLRTNSDADSTGLLASPRGESWSVRAVQRIISQATDDLGVTLTSTRTARKGRSADAAPSWLTLARAS